MAEGRGRGSHDLLRWFESTRNCNKCLTMYYKMQMTRIREAVLGARVSRAAYGAGFLALDILLLLTCWAVTIVVYGKQSLGPVFLHGPFLAFVMLTPNKKETAESTPPLLLYPHTYEKIQVAIVNIVLQCVQKEKAWRQRGFNPCGDWYIGGNANSIFILILDVCFHRKRAQN